MCQTTFKLNILNKEGEFLKKPFLCDDGKIAQSNEVLSTELMM